jgi:hypothetical protein
VINEMNDIAMIVRNAAAEKNRIETKKKNKQEQQSRRKKTARC